MKISTLIKGSDRENPFKDSQARSFSNTKLISEFCPTSFFWSLFNDQHEIIIGTRGSGKTIMFRMMQYSLLKQIAHDVAKQLVQEKQYIALYIPTNIEFLRSINPVELDEEAKILYFQFGFNCILSQTFLTEIENIIDDYKIDFVEQSIQKKQVVEIISKMWFPNDSINGTFEDLSFKIDSMYQNFNFNDISSFYQLPNVFNNNIGKPIESISKHIFDKLGLSKEPTWILNIDEAEFLDVEHQKCFNSLFRSYSHGIVIKIATLPFKHLTQETTVCGIFAEPNGNDFNYRSIEFDPTGDDFEMITNRLCSNRLKKILGEAIPDQITLSDFVGVIGSDAQIDYYRLEIGENKSNRSIIEKSIIEQFSKERKINALGKGIGSRANRKEVYDKFAPVFFVREMFKISKMGRRIPGFYAGANVIRKMSEGNPRIFIQIMNQLFEGARNAELTPKKQHTVIMTYAKQHCEITKRLPLYGADLADYLDQISSYLHDLTHGSELKDCGNSFFCNKVLLDDQKFIESIKLGSAYSRLKIDENSLLYGITDKTEFILSNIYSLVNWIPMRKAGNSICWKGGIKMSKRKEKRISSQQSQLFFE